MKANNAYIVQRPASAAVTRARPAHMVWTTSPMPCGITADLVCSHAVVPATAPPVNGPASHAGSSGEVLRIKMVRWQAAAARYETRYGAARRGQQTLPQRQLADSRSVPASFGFPQRWLPEELATTAWDWACRTTGDKEPTPSHHYPRHVPRHHRQAPPSSTALSRAAASFCGAAIPRGAKALAHVEHRRRRYASGAGHIPQRRVRLLGQQLRGASSAYCRCLAAGPCRPGRPARSAAVRHP